MQTHSSQSLESEAAAHASISSIGVDGLGRPPERFLDVGHAKLAYRRFGQGPDVLFVHGWPVSSSTFRGVVAELEPDYTCHLVDLPGAGHSRWTDASRIGIREHGETVAEVIDLLGLSRVALVSHDSGGAIARIAAALRPDAVAGLVLGNTEIPGHTPALIKLLLMVTRIPGAARLFVESMRFGPIRRSRTLGFGTCFEDPSFTDGDFYRLAMAPLFSNPEQRDGALALMNNLDVDVLHGLEALHRRIDVPVRMVWGSRDPVFPLEKARRMIDQFGGEADLVEIPRGWLFAHEEFAAEFAAHSRPLLERVLG